MTNHYETLGVARDATPEEIKATYRRQSKRWHPDRPGGDHEKMTAIVQAYKILSDPDKRAHYDETGQDTGINQTDQQAMSLLASFFAKYIDSEDFSNPLPKIRKAVRDGIREYQQRIDDAKRDLAKLAKRAGTVKFKKAKGIDLFNMALARKQQDCRGTIASNQQQMQIAERCLLLIDEYECHIVDVPPFHATASAEESINQGLRRARNRIEQEILEGFFGRYGK